MLVSSALVMTASMRRSILMQRFALVVEGRNFVPARFEHASHDQPRGAAWIH
jgi:hypothetical protein